MLQVKTAGLMMKMKCLLALVLQLQSELKREVLLHQVLVQKKYLGGISGLVRGLRLNEYLQKE